MADSPQHERYVDRWERTEAIDQDGDQDNTGTVRSVIVHRRPDMPTFLVHGIINEDSESEMGGQVHDANLLEDAADAVLVLAGASEYTSPPDPNAADDPQVTWTRRFEGVDDNTTLFKQHKGGVPDTESQSLETDISLGEDIDGAGADVGEECVNVDSGAVGVGSSYIPQQNDYDDDDEDDRRCDEEVEQYSFRSDMFGAKAVDGKSDVLMDEAEDNQMLPCAERWERTLGVDGSDSDSSHARQISVHRDKYRFGAGVHEVEDTGLDTLPRYGSKVDSVAFIVAAGVQDRVDGSNMVRGEDVSSEDETTKVKMRNFAVVDVAQKEPLSVEEGDLSNACLAETVPKEDDGIIFQTDKDESNSEEESAICDDSIEDKGSQVNIVRRVERSFSIGEDGRKNQITDRLVQRRKTIEVDKEDLSGVEARHTSCLNIMIGGNAEVEESVVSEINVIWGKTIDTDMEQVDDTSDGAFQSDALVSPTGESLAGSSVGDIGEYWSGDVSTDTVRTSDSFDTYVDTGDSMYTSESNNSPRDSRVEYFCPEDKMYPPQFQSTPRNQRAVKRSEAFHFVWDPQHSPLQSKSFSLWEEGAGQVVTISSVPNTLRSQTSYTTGPENTVVSRLDISSEKTIDIADSDLTEPAPHGNDQQTHGAREDKPSKAAKDLFKVSEDIANLGLVSDDSLVHVKGEDTSNATNDIERPDQSICTNENEKNDNDANGDEIDNVSDSGPVESANVDITGSGDESASTSFVDRKEEHLEIAKDLPRILSRPLSLANKSFPEPRLQGLSVDAGPHGDSSDLPMSPGNEGPNPESLDSCRQFEDDEFVPLASKKKKRLKKKKKKCKEFKDSARAEEAPPIDPEETVYTLAEKGDGEMSGGAAAEWVRFISESVPQKQFLQTDDNWHEEFFVGGNERQTTELASADLNADKATEVADGKEFARSEIDFQRVDEGNDLVVDTGQKNKAKEEQECELCPSDFPKPQIEIEGSNDTNLFETKSGSDIANDQHNDDNDEVKTAPSESAQDYLTHIFKDAETDPQMMLLHSEGQDGDVLLNVSKGRRRILKPHRRFTKNPQERAQNEAGGAVVDSSENVSHCPMPSEEQSTDDGSNIIGPQPVNTDTEKLMKCEDKDRISLDVEEDTCDKDDGKNRKRLSGGQLKFSQDQSADTYDESAVPSDSMLDSNGNLDPKVVGGNDDREDNAVDTNNSDQLNKEDTSYETFSGDLRQVVSYEDIDVFDSQSDGTNIITSDRPIVGAHDDSENAVIDIVPVPGDDAAGTDDGVAHAASDVTNDGAMDGVAVPGDDVADTDDGVARAGYDGAIDGVAVPGDDVADTYDGVAHAASDVTNDGAIDGFAVPGDDAAGTDDGHIPCDVTNDGDDIATGGISVSDVSKDTGENEKGIIMVNPSSDLADVEISKEGNINGQKQLQTVEDNPLLWPKKGKKKKKKRNKKDKQNPSSFEEVKDSELPKNQQDSFTGEKRETDEIDVIDNVNRVSIGQDIDSPTAHNDADLYVERTSLEHHVIKVPANQGEKIWKTFDQADVVVLPSQTSEDDSTGFDVALREDGGDEAAKTTVDLNSNDDDSLVLAERSVDRFESFYTDDEWVGPVTIERPVIASEREEGDDKQKWAQESTVKADFIVYPFGAEVGAAELRDDTKTVLDDESISGNYADNIEVDDSGRMLDALIKDLVSDVDIHAVGDIKIYIDDDRVESIDALSPQEGGEESIYTIDMASDEVIDDTEDLTGFSDPKDMSKADTNVKGGISSTISEFDVKKNNVIDENNVSTGTIATGPDKPDPEFLAAPHEPEVALETLADDEPDHPDGQKSSKKKKKKRKKKEKADMDSSSGDPVSRRGQGKAEQKTPLPQTVDSANAVFVSEDITATVDIDSIGRETLTDVLTGDTEEYRNQSELLVTDGETTREDMTPDNEMVIKDRAFYIDRHEEYMPSPTPSIVTRRLLEDVVSNRARAQEVAARDPEITSTLGGTPLSAPTLTSSGELSTPLTAGGHLLSEMSMLETAAREQTESLRLAVAQQAKYETQIEQLNTSISEAQGKLLASPVMATSVGALKQQIAEHNDLASQIKHYQTAVNEVTEKNRELALDSAHLSPKLFRKHYLPESAYDDYFSAAQIHHRVGSPLPTSSPLFYETLPTFELTSPKTYSGAPQTAGDRKVIELPGDTARHRNETSLSDSPLSLDLPRKIPPPKKDTIPRPTWSEGTPNLTAPGVPAPLKSPTISKGNDLFFGKSETYESPEESVTTSGYATAPSSARSLGAGVAPIVKKSGSAYAPSSTTSDSGPKLLYKSPEVFLEKTQTPLKDSTNVHRVTDVGANDQSDNHGVSGLASDMSKVIGPRALSIETGLQLSKRPMEASTEITPPSASFDSGLDTGTNVSLNLASQRQPSPASSVSSVVERLAAAMAASPPTRAPPAGGRPTELLRMGSSTENLSTIHASVASPVSPRFGSVDSLVRKQASLNTSLSTPRDSMQDSFHSAQASPRVTAPADSTKQQQRLIPQTQAMVSATSPWKSISETNLTASVKSPRFGDASATSTPRSSLAQVITGTAVVKSPRVAQVQAKDAWASLDLDAETPVTLASPHISEDSHSAVQCKPTTSQPRIDHATTYNSHKDLSKTFSDLALLPASTYKIPKTNFPPSKPKQDLPRSQPAFSSSVKTSKSAALEALTSSMSPSSNRKLSPSQPLNGESLKPSKVSSTVASPSFASLQKKTNTSSVLVKPKVSPVPVLSSSSISEPSRNAFPTSHRITSLSVTEDRTISVSAFSPLAVPKVNSPSLLLTKSVVDQVTSTKQAGNGTATTKSSTSSTLTTVRLGGAVGTASMADGANKSGLTPLRTRGTLKL
ncbi:nesprin-1-like, partial [Plakobranchus ocellatus]